MSPVTAQYVSRLCFFSSDYVSRSVARRYKSCFSERTNDSFARLTMVDACLSSFTAEVTQTSTTDSSAASTRESLSGYVVVGCVFGLCFTSGRVGRYCDAGQTVLRVGRERRVRRGILTFGLVRRLHCNGLPARRGQHAISRVLRHCPIMVITINRRDTSRVNVKYSSYRYTIKVYRRRGARSRPLGLLRCRLRHHTIRQRGQGKVIRGVNCLVLQLRVICPRIGRDTY